VTDTNSGIAKYYVKADTGSWIDNNTNTSYAFTNQSAATHTYQAKAVDNAGNETTAQITTTIEPTDNRASSTPGGSTGTTPAGTTTIFTTQKTGTPTEQQIEQTLAQAGYTQQQINSTMQTAKNTPTTQTATATRETGITGTSYRAKITIAIANNSANKWREIKVIAEIPKTIAENAGLIDSNSPFTALKADPIIQFIIPEIQAGQTREISYSVAKNTPESTAQSIPQAIVASYAQTEPCDGVSCDEGNACATGTCNNATGKCEYSYEQDGTACGENKKCVQGTCAEKQDSQAGSSRPTDPQQQPENAPAAGLAIILPAVLAIAIIAAAGYYWHTRSRP
jgi:hypothetical protein